MNAGEAWATQKVMPRWRRPRVRGSDDAAAVACTAHDISAASSGDCGRMGVRGKMREMRRDWRESDDEAGAGAA